MKYNINQAINSKKRQNQISLDNLQIPVQSMSNQIKPQKLDENQQQPKKYKRSTIEEMQESIRKNKLKQQQQQKPNKITRYFMQNAAAKPTSPIKIVATQPSQRASKIQVLEEQIKLKDNEIKQLKEKKLWEDDKINFIQFQMRQFKNKSKPLIAKTLLQITESKRQQRRDKTTTLGHFVQGLRFFVEGEALTSVKTQIEDKQASIKKLQEILKAKKGSEEYVRVLSSLEFSQKQLNDLKKQLQLKQKEVVAYKDRMKLVQKQNKSHYFRKGWPIIYDRYQTLELLGSGGFGQVYKCYDLDNNKWVAVKRVVFPERGDAVQRQDFFRHVLREAEIQKQLNHPNIARFQSIIQVDTSQNLLVFQLQYCGGPELSLYLRKYGCLEEKEAKVIMRQLFSAIEYLSKLKERIIHYDLKPSNIMFHEGVVKILDFGLSKIMLGEDSRMDLTSQGVGTYWYLPPQTFEQFSPQISSKVDVWSLGVIFFELLYGRKPFGHGIGQQQIFNDGVILRAVKVQFPAENPRRFKVSQAAKDFICKCLKYTQQQRLSPSQAYNHDYFRK